MERKDFLKNFAVGGNILLTAPVILNSCSKDDTDTDEPTPNPNEIIVDLKYRKIESLGGGGIGKPCITNLKRISTPGLRIYTNSRDIPQSFGGMGIVIISTSKGLMTDRDARKAKLGGEILCSVW